jgi:transcriptional regulator with XRE-family HTH domain
MSKASAVPGACSTEPPDDERAWQPVVLLFAGNVWRLRREKKLSQAQVSSRSGIHVTEVSRIERGLRDPRISTVVRLARALGVEPGSLLAPESSARA